MRGFNRTMEIRKTAAKLFESLDFVLSPTAPVAGFPADWASPLNDPDKPFEHIGYTVAWNMSEQPAVSINCGYTAAGLPIGLQIVGRRFDDHGVLQLAQAYEDRRGPQRPWPVL
jgi:aspartyl-tRNA(Asn)/glutamyl-tRNA(Gln) amidotransferase subunit A